MDPKLIGTYKRGELTVLHDPAVMTKVVKALRSVGRRVALVPTMGALHEGHLELVRLAKLTNTTVIVSIFVNPLQFGANEDLDKYPRTLDADVELLRGEGVELVFAPSAQDMYPFGTRTTVQAGPYGDILEGATRPGHFSGVLTVVSKLFNICMPHEAFFGEKDYQQLALIRQMVVDLNMDVKIVPAATVREADGLAKSSRNRYLSAAERELATTLSAALLAGRHAAGRGPEAVLETAQSVLDLAPDIQVDYLALRGADFSEQWPTGNARLLVAARVGTTRLIDNMPVSIGKPLDGHPTAPDQPAQAAL
ncbi:pantoate--beta-alanine ligase [Nocardia sp. NPDC051981]|uniref:pantoate--beta-alanine ligase n=1 Tax=Nocardia sp. NPDC051981 TaxID=3155417 RepID=UPI0034124BF4